MIKRSSSIGSKRSRNKILTILIVLIFVGALLGYVYANNTSDDAITSGSPANGGLTAEEAEEIPGLETDTPAPVEPQPVDESQGENSMIVQSSRSSYTVGDDVVVQIRMDSQAEVNSIQIKLRYEASVLEFDSASYSDSSFAIGAEEVVSNGEVSIARASIEPVTGSAGIVTVTFKAQKSAANTVLDLTEGSALLSGSTSTNVLTNRQSLTLQVN